MEMIRWRETIQGLRSVSTLMPPTTACSGTPSMMISARPRISLVLWAHLRTARYAATTTATNTYVSIRLLNSMTPWAPRARCGTNELSVQRGQVGQPRPEPVRRTSPPVKTMTELATTAAHAQRSTTAWSGDLILSEAMASLPFEGPGSECAGDCGPDDQDDDREQP